MSKSFLPFHEIPNRKKVIVVDSYYKGAFTLSHWRGTPKHPKLHDDTSAGICLNAIKHNIPELAYSYVTNNHFDVDGFLGIWSIMNPKLALEYENPLRLAALLGDFRETDWKDPDMDLALKIVCWINTVEKKKFYPPFGFKAFGENEAKICIRKYDYFIPVFEEVLQNIDAYREEWEEEYEQVKIHSEIVKGVESSRTYVDNIRLMIVETPQPLHYYALFGESKNYDIVMCVYQDQRYELEYKYTTWVDTATRNAFPRIHLKGLASRLNEFERSHESWIYDSIMDTGPSLRLEIKGLSKEARFDHPFTRIIPSSSISPEIFKKEVIQYYRAAYKNIEQRYQWTWKEMRDVQSSLSSA